MYGHNNIIFLTYVWRDGFEIILPFEQYQFIITFGSKLKYTSCYNKLNIEIREDQSNMADGGSGINNKTLKTVLTKLFSKDYMHVYFIKIQCIFLINESTTKHNIQLIFMLKSTQ